jgi:hypothetical protein
MGEIMTVITADGEMTATGAGNPETVPEAEALDEIGPEAEVLEKTDPEARDGVVPEVLEIGIVGEVRNEAVGGAALEVRPPDIPIAALWRNTYGVAEMETRGRAVVTLVPIDAGKSRAGCLGSPQSMIMKRKVR